MAPGLRGGLTMRLTAAIEGNLAEALKAEADKLGKAVAAAVQEATTALKNDLARDVEAAGLGSRLSRTWRARFYRNRGIDAAGLVYSKAAPIIEFFDGDGAVRPKRGRYLTIPTGFNRKGGRRGADVLVTAKELAATPGLGFVARSKEGALLWWMRVAKAVRVRETEKNGVRRFRPVRSGGRSLVDVFVGDKRIRSKKRRVLAAQYGAVPMFVLVESVPRTKRLQVAYLAQKARGDMIASLARNLAA